MYLPPVQLLTLYLSQKVINSGLICISLTASALSEDFFVHKSYQRMSPAASDFIFTRTRGAGSQLLWSGFLALWQNDCTFRNQMTGILCDRIRQTLMGNRIDQ
ncbi:hypothetical protein AVEN_260730-1 [Araneus ventricosus]|uniref:Uncharacterized protein n=1 Tax=Araneus ventricosus TaxID=182803 RepID=A0A4Y2PRM8_ARAVE|nr:hypothetical protein AVEN_260730-1 [Araneus ventricosus]